MYSQNDWRNYSDELMHYGIQGQKWGVRNYQNADGSLTDAGRARYGSRNSATFKNRMKDRVNNVKWNVQDTIKNTKNAKGVWNKGSELLGQGAAATAARNRQFTQENLSKHSNTKLGKRYHDQQAANAESMKDYHKNKQAKYDIHERGVGKVLVDKAVDSVFDVELLQTPYQRLSGRETTQGRRIVDAYLTYGVAGLAMDAGYLINKNR